MSKEIQVTIEPLGTNAFTGQLLDKSDRNYELHLNAVKKKAERQLKLSLPLEEAIVVWPIEHEVNPIVIRNTYVLTSNISWGRIVDIKGSDDS